MQNYLAHKEIHNIYSLVVNGEEIYIGDASSGINHYCRLGCKREMPVVKATLRRAYFRKELKLINSR